MTDYYSHSSGALIQLIKQLSSGGEGTIWLTQNPDQVVKLYTYPTPQRIAKLKLMLANAPEDPKLAWDHLSVAWPQDLVTDATGAVVGFSMQRIQNSVTLTRVYHPRHRQRELPGFNWYYLHVTALNVCKVVELLHLKGYVIGDINSKNILVNNRAKIAIIDTDSFQVSDPITATIYHCPVGLPEYKPPELHGYDLAQMVQTPAHDYFSLAILIYQLLFGQHPFQGRWLAEGDPPDPMTFLQQGLWPYQPQSCVALTPGAIPLHVVHPDLQHLLLTSFNEGHRDPDQRVSPSVWAEALQVAIQDLKVCEHSTNHYFSHVYGTCYWCERTQQGGRDPFLLPLKPTRKRLTATSGTLMIPLSETQENSTHHELARLGRASAIEDLLNKYLNPKSVQVSAERRDAALALTLFHSSDDPIPFCKHVRSYLERLHPKGIELVVIYSQFKDERPILQEQVSLNSQLPFYPIFQLIPTFLLPFVALCSLMVLTSAFGSVLGVIVFAFFLLMLHKES